MVKARSTHRNGGARRRIPPNRRAVERARDSGHRSAPAVASTYCVPAAVDALVGPRSAIVGRWLSTSIVRAYITDRSAASLALIFSGSRPCP